MNSWTASAAERDEQKAREMRERLGRGSRWLVSWEACGKNRWLARVSCPDHPETIERVGTSRIAAIWQAVKDLVDVIEAERKARRAGDDRVEAR